MLLAPRQIKPIYVTHYPRADQLNLPLIQAFNQLTAADFTRRSHFINGRYENLYLELNTLPGLEQVLQFVRDCAANILANDNRPLRQGFWLNAMAPGDHTSLHSHDENDELLSAVYYVTVPEKSGDIVFIDSPFNIRITPTAGMVLLFPPDLLHQVECNHSGTKRLSIAFNFGLADTD
ncbi:hypothetical protein HUK38_08530 [Thiospirillum jenense]|uniref:Fe2OG dioxygenase domain-containing protein n=2 Tax=Thiospirillum jenense TaxID=1653858 RepID=A0A839HG35_9GAMM|nr:hypothetical protein [Thiospirillum jenense]